MMPVCFQRESLSQPEVESGVLDSCQFSKADTFALRIRENFNNEFSCLLNSLVYLSASMTNFYPEKLHISEISLGFIFHFSHATCL